MIGRRGLAGGLGATLTGSLLAGRARAMNGPFAALPATLARIEAESGGRLGVAVLDTASKARAGHRAAEPFPMCSTFKFLLAGAVLARVDAGQDSLDRRIAFGREDLVTYSPVTGPRSGDGMMVGELCAAAMVLSDNTAANLLLASLGGPAGLTAWLRRLGDPVTRLDRVEPGLNEAAPGDPRDTTTPDAMLADLRALALGTALADTSRGHLVDWLVGCRTGDARLRAGVPAGWRVGDKTGTGENGTSNDIGILWPPGRPPVLIVAYLTGSPAGAGPREATFAAVARSVTAALAG